MDVLEVKRPGAIVMGVNDLKLFFDIHYIGIICLLLFSCSEIRQGDFPVIPVDIEQDFSLPLSEIAEEIIAIEPEFTDNSMINPDQIIRVFFDNDYVIVAESRKILVFDMDGKYIRTIGSKGQGPGEFTSVIGKVAFDETNKRLFVSANPKIICYDLNGDYIKETSFTPQAFFAPIIDMNCFNGKLLLVVDEGTVDEMGFYNLSVMYQFNDELQITESCTIRKTHFERFGFYSNRYCDHILYDNSTVYLYNPDLYVDVQNPAETVLRDTLYRFEKTYRIPEFKLKFKDNGIINGNKFIHLLNVYRSSRYFFAIYDKSEYGNRFHFCYDTKTGKGYNMRDGYTDDINKIEKRISSIHPLNTNPDIFYYWHTHIKSDKLEEPNPTLYIGKLKK